MENLFQHSGELFGGILRSGPPRGRGELSSIGMKREKVLIMHALRTFAIDRRIELEKDQVAAVSDPNCQSSEPEPLDALREAGRKPSRLLSTDLCVHPAFREVEVACDRRDRP
jgi:hypothetical protein